MMRVFCVFMFVALVFGAEAEEVRFEARVEAVSLIPDPARSDYKDCLFALKVAPRVPPGKAPCSVLLLLDAFRARKLTPYSHFEVSDIIRVHALPLEEMPKDYQSLQLVDDTDELDIPVLGGLRAAKMESFSEATGWAWQGIDRDATVDLPKQVVRFPASAEAREKTIQRDLQAIQGKLAEKGTWSAWYDTLAAVREPLLAQLAESTTGYLRKDTYVFRFAGALDYRLTESDSKYQRALRAMQVMHDQFAQMGTDLIVVPIPMRDQVYASKFVAEMPEDGVLQPYWLKFQYDLLSRGIEVVDLLPAYRDALDEEEFLYHYNTTDGHPATAGVLIAADTIAERLRRYWFSTPRRLYRTDEHLYKKHDFDELFPLDTHYPSVRVAEYDGEIILNEDVSEVILMGDSMVNAPAGAKHAQLLHHLVRHVGFPISIFKRAGGAHEIPKSLYRDVSMDYLSGRSVCILTIAFASISQSNRVWAETEFVSGRAESKTP